MTEPAVGIGHAVAGLPDAAFGRNPHVVETIGRVMRRIGVAEQGVGDHLDARRTLVDKEQCLVILFR